MKISKNELKQIFFSHWEQRGLAKISSESVVPTTWPHSLFIVSGLIRYLENIENQWHLGKNLVMCQPCVKHGTSYLSLETMLKKDGYFTFFEQLSCGIGEIISISSFVSFVWNFFSDVLKINKKRIFVGVSGKQPDLALIWKKAGVSEDNLIFPDPKAFELYMDDGLVEGIYSSIYFDRHELRNYPCANPKCGINCDCDRFLELGDIGIIHYHGQLIFDHGIGMERLLSVSNNLSRVTDLDEFQELKATISHFASLNESKEHVVIDHFRSIAILVSSGETPTNKGRGYVLRSFLRNIFWILSEEKKICRPLDLLDLDELRNIFRILEAHHPTLLGHEDRFIAEIFSEIETFTNLVKRGKKVLSRVRKDKSTLLPEDFVLLHETHGLPRDFVKFLIERSWP